MTKYEQVIVKTKGSKLYDYFSTTLVPELNVMICRAQNYIFTNKSPINNFEFYSVEIKMHSDFHWKMENHIYNDNHYCLLMILFLLVLRLYVRYYTCHKCTYIAIAIDFIRE